MATNLHVYPAPIIQEGRIFKETAALEDAGWFDEIIICGTRSNGLPATQVLSPVRRVERLGGGSSERPSSVLVRLIERVRWSFAVYRRFRSADLTVVNAHSVAVLPVCVALARRHRAHLVYDTHELETETIASRGLQRRIFQFIERKFIHRAALVLVVNDSIADWYERRYRLRRPTVVRNIPDPPARIIPVDVRARLSIPSGTRVFVHTGNITGGRNIEAILAAFGEVDDHVVFLGDGPLSGAVDDAAMRRSNIHHVPAVRAGDVVGFVAGCDVGLCLVEPIVLSYRLSLPNKAFEYMLARVPFFFTDLPEVERLAGDALAGWKVIEPSKHLAEAIRTLSGDEIARASRSLQTMQLPDWPSDTAGMVAAYRGMFDGAGST